MTFTTPQTVNNKPTKPVKTTVYTPKQKRELKKVDPLLLDILSTKRPTNNPAQNLAYTTQLLDSLNICYSVDKNHNTTVTIGKSKSCFTAHTDTVDNKTGTNQILLVANILSVYGGGILGADCGAGMYILIKMILANVPGLYVFFATEEQGRIGSERYVMPATIERCISFDRKGLDNLITHQMGEPGCSDDFANTFIACFDLPYKKDPTGSFTDSYSFFQTVPECINLSVGYYDQHSKHETQDIEHLEKLAKASISMPWETLPTVRDPSLIAFDDCQDTPFNYQGCKIPALSEESKIEKFVWDNPETTARILIEYGLTLADLQAFKADDDYHNGNV
jgi:hypothetical protein